MRQGQVINVYAAANGALPQSQDNLNPILQALWSTSPSEKQMAEYRSRRNSFRSVPSPEYADLVLLCFTWNHYLNRGLVSLAQQEAAAARKAHKPFVVFSQGDYTANLPFDGAVVFQTSCYHSRRTANGGGGEVYALPSFIPDYQILYNDGKEDIRPKAAHPIVGFCGQAGGSILDVVRRAAACQARKCAYRLGLRQWEPPPFETVRWRKRVLDCLSRDPRLETRFIIRRRYRAGYSAKKKDPFHPTRLEMVDNIRNANYTVCVRGGGNFSVRLYETLSLGRIPIFVDTDCILPYDKIIDWRRYCVWVDSADLSSISQKVLDFHAALADEEFLQRQRECRRLWQQWLSADGFWHHFACHFAKP